MGRFARQPQSVWLRRVCLQIHLWIGISLGLYVVIISATGSAIVYRVEIDKAFSHHTALIAPANGIRMTDQQLGALARGNYPRFNAEEVQIHKRPAPDAAVEVWLISGSRKLERRFDPFTGANLGDTINVEPGFVTWLVKLHADLLSNRNGRLANGYGALAVTVLCLTGMIIWWPGVARWTRSMTIRRGTGWRRLNWDLHSAIGIWLLLPTLMWALTGLYMTFPQPFENLVALFELDGIQTRWSTTLDSAFAWLVRLHFGRTFGPVVKALWVTLGLLPLLLFVTGFVMWWNRSLRRPWRHWREEFADINPAKLRIGQ